MLHFSDLVRISARQVLRQRKRYLGVVLAVAFGTAGLVAVASMGEEVKNNLNRDLDLLGGATLIKVFFNNQDRLSRPPIFHDPTVREIRALPSVKTASLTAGDTAWVDARFDNRYFKAPIQGVDEYYWPANGLYAVTGTLFTDEDVENRRRVCVLGEEAATQFYGTLDIAGKLFPINNDLYHVTGVVGGLQIGDRKRFGFVPLTTLQDRIQKDIKPDRLYVRCKTWDDVGITAEAIPKIVAEHQATDNLMVQVAWDHLASIKNIVWWVELFVILSISATLILGGFGMWNGMMSTVKARTREIGLKKAMGAENNDITKQFLAEALCLSIGSAFLGIFFGRIVIQIAAYMLDSTPQESLFLTYSLMSMIFSVILGVAAGLYPSITAGRMDVVTAIRYE